MGITIKNRLSHHKQDRLIQHFVSATTARTPASLCAVNHKTAAFYCHLLWGVVTFDLEAGSNATREQEYSRR